MEEDVGARRGTEVKKWGGELKKDNNNILYLYNINVMELDRVYSW